MEYARLANVELHNLASQQHALKLRVLGEIHYNNLKYTKMLHTVLEVPPSSRNALPPPSTLRQS